MKLHRVDNFLHTLHVSLYLETSRANIINDIISLFSDNFKIQEKRGDHPKFSLDPHLTNYCLMHSFYSAT